MYDLLIFASIITIRAVQWTEQSQLIDSVVRELKFNPNKTLTDNRPELAAIHKFSSKELAQCYNPRFGGNNQTLNIFSMKLGNFVRGYYQDELKSSKKFNHDDVKDCVTRLIDMARGVLVCLRNPPAHRSTLGITNMTCKKFVHFRGG